MVVGWSRNDPDPRPQRRRFTAENILTILDEYEEGPGRARRVGDYAGTYQLPQPQPDTDALVGLASRPRPANKTSVQAWSVIWPRIGAALSIMGKAHELMELLSESSDTEWPSRP